MKHTVYEFSAQRITGEKVSLGNFEGKVLLIVNVASECGLTPQYEGLEKIYEEFKDQGFEILGFPANEFGAQEPGTNEEIQEFCQTRFGVKFPMFEKIVVKGKGQHPLYHFLTEQRPSAQMNPGSSFEEKLAKHGIKKETAKDITWNFEKFLIDRKGEVVERFAPDVKPEDPLVTTAIRQLL